MLLVEIRQGFVVSTDLRFKGLGVKQSVGNLNERIVETEIGLDLRLRHQRSSLDERFHLLQGQILSHLLFKSFRTHAILTQDEDVPLLIKLPLGLEDRVAQQLLLDFLGSRGKSQILWPPWQ